MRARTERIHNFSVFCNHVTIIPAIRAILDSPDMRIDAFIGPGHVFTVIGCRPVAVITRIDLAAAVEFDWPVALACVGEDRRRIG